MKNITFKILIILGMTAAGMIWNGNFHSPAEDLIAKADARIGRPATPISYAGVARRTTVRVATPGAGAPGVGMTRGVGVGAPGRGATPGVGAGAPGVGVAPRNVGGPVNRVGLR